MKFVSRSQWGARAYRTPNGATPYSRARRGVKLHYLGTAYADRPHTQCAAYVRQLQAQHMDGNGWSDVGYSFLVCTHGYVYEGRGLKRRNSANGNTTLNEQDYAVCLLVGSTGLTKPTDDQLDGARDAIEYCRSEGPAGEWLGGHRDGFATACPGPAVYAWVQKGAPRPSGGEMPTGGTYTVKPGDNLTAIAKAHGTTVTELVKLNGLKDPDRLDPGQELKLPTAAKPAQAKPAAPAQPSAPKFPGRDYFKPGQSNKYVTQLGQQLVRKGYGKHYAVGPGPRWGEADRRNVQDFQRAQKWTGSDADGYPGPETWRRLFA